MKTIKNILVPTDFSATASNALEYAKALATTFGAQITVVHVQPFLLTNSEIAIPIFHTDLTAQIQENLNDFVADARHTETIAASKTTTKILTGDAVAEVVELSNSKDYDLIVIGMTGLQDFISRFFGSTSLEVSNKSTCPVLLIPRDMKWRRVERILFATDRPTVTHKTVSAAFDWAQSLHSSLHFLHIEGSDTGDYELTKKIWEETSSERRTTVSYEIKTIHSEDPAEELQRYADDKDVDWLIFVGAHRNFWQNMIHQSVSQKVALNSTKPVLVMHLDDHNIASAN